MPLIISTFKAIQVENFNETILPFPIITNGLSAFLSISQAFLTAKGSANISGGSGHLG